MAWTRKVYHHNDMQSNLIYQNILVCTLPFFRKPLACRLAMDLEAHFAPLGMVLMLVLAALHLNFAGPDMKVLLRLAACRDKLQKDAQNGDPKEKNERFEKELLKARREIFGTVNRFAVHLVFLVNLATMWQGVTDPSMTSVMNLLGPLFAYAVHAAHQAGLWEIKTNTHFLMLEVAFCSVYAVNLCVAANQTDFEVFLSNEKALQGGMVFASVVFIDWKLPVPAYALGAVVLTHKQWQLLGFPRVSPTLMCHTLFSHTSTLLVVVFTVHLMRSYIAARLDSDDTSSLLLAFRRVLRGVCDGELVLDRRNHRIVDDASSLEKLLNAQKKLSETNFLDLFLDTEGRQRFLEFLDSEASTKDSQSTIPACLRIALQGAAGPVSTDVFFTRCGVAAQDYYLLAFRADPEQFLAPPAADGQQPRWQYEQPQPPQVAPPSSAEVVGAFKELVQATVLVSNETPAMDVEEVTLSFQRSKDRSADSGMPTLRSFIRINDWERVEQLFNKVQVSEADQDQQVRFPSPLLLRIPGSRPPSYLCAKSVSVSIAEEDEGQGARSFWLHLDAFDLRHSRRRKEQDLESISEDG